MNHFKLTAGVTLAALLVLPGLLAAQPGGRQGPNPDPGVLVGQVYDADLVVPVEYANIVVYAGRDSGPVTGTVTGPDGRFELRVRSGRYELEISFIGYATRQVDEVSIVPGGRADLGRLEIRQAVVAVEGAEAVAARPTLSFQIDKKVIDVGQQPAAAAGTAVDVLETAPSIKVDVDGGVSLRGSRNFTVLIDGRPTLLEPDEALQQTPASSLERVEIITNPSARYDAEGATGIINLIMKQQRQVGLSGQASATAGLQGRYGGDLLLNWRSGIASLLLGVDCNRRTSPGTDSSERWTAEAGDTTRLSATGFSNSGGRFGGGRLGAELQWSPADRTVFGSRLALNGAERVGATDFVRRAGGGTERYASADTSNRGGNHLAFSVEHRHRFGPARGNGDAHELSGRFEYSTRARYDTALTVLADSAGAVTDGWRTVSSGPGNRTQANLDYVLPISPGRLEAGYQAALGGPEQASAAWEFDPDSGRFVPRPEYDYRITMRNDIHALYTTWAGNWRQFGYQVGLRAEYNNRVIETDSGRHEIEPLDFFPTAHLSYRLPAGVELAAGFSRRIRRPRGWEMFPFLAWEDAFNVRRGNPDLVPERINALEAGATVPFGAGRVSLEAYLRTSTDRIEHVRTVYAPEVVLHSAANVGSDRALGVELATELVPVKWWTVNLAAGTFDYRVETGTGEQASFNWNARLANDFRFGPDTRVQVGAGYESPTATSQGRTEGFVRTELGVRQQFLDRRLTLALALEDPFGWSRYRYESGGPGYDFLVSESFRRDWPVASLSVTLNFNDFRFNLRQLPRSEDDDFESETERMP